MSSDFPALPGSSAGDSNNAGNARGHLASLSLGSYATQLGHQATGTAATGQSQSFTPDDFPPIGGPGYSSASFSNAFGASNLFTAQASDANGVNSAPAFSADKLMQEQQNAAAALAHRQGLLGQLGPINGSASIAAQQRLPSSSFSPEEQKRLQASKAGQQIWAGQLPSASQPLPNGLTQSQPPSAGSTPSTQPNGISSTNASAQSARIRSPSVPAVQAGANSTTSANRVLPPLSGRTASLTLASTSTTNGVSSASDSYHSPSSMTSSLPRNSHAQQSLAMPQTPAQQVLFSPADRFGLLGLLHLIKNADADQTMLSLGQDLSKLGLDLGRKESIVSYFVTPWADQAPDGSLPPIEPEFSLPACYNVHPPTATSKIAQFSDETLFYIFYTQPRDVLQEAAAQALHQHNWRFHKDLKVWLTKEVGVEPTQKTSSYERGSYILFQPSTWEKVKKEFMLVYDQLEQRLPQPISNPTNTA